MGKDDAADELRPAARVKGRNLTSERRRPSSAAQIQRQRPDSGENINVSDRHHPFCTPTKHTLSTRNRQTKTFPKSTYATGDDGIPGESQRKLRLGEQKSEFLRFRAESL